MASGFNSIKMSEMANQAKVVFRHEMNLAKERFAAGLCPEAMHHLERAHIVGQRFFWAHLVTHWWMLRIAVMRNDRREVLGQIKRLFAVGPAYVIGWVPVGNTGGANVSAVMPMPIPTELQPCFVGYSMWRQVGWRLLLILGGVLAALLLSSAEPMQQMADDVEQGTRVQANSKLSDFGVTETLEIIPLVNWHAAGKNLRTEAGVSYLIKTDKNTVLFDTGWNEKDETPSPLEHNMAQLGIAPASIDSIFISHAHHDHVGGRRWESAASFALGATQSDLSGKRAFAPVPLSYPGVTVQTVTGASELLPAVASTGPIARDLSLGRIDEQAMVVQVAGKGLVVIVGCGHQTVPKLLAKIKREFSAPIYGIVGDLHYPVPDGRRSLLGINVQRRLASGEGFFRPLGMETVKLEMDLLEREKLQLIGLGGHDTSDEVIALFAQRFGSRYRSVAVGKPIVLNRS